MSKTALFATAAIACLTASGDAFAQQPRPWDTAYALFQALPAPLDGQVRTANANDVVFSQQVRVAEAVRLNSAVSAWLTAGRSQTSLVVPEGAVLYRVSFERNPDMRAYCAVDTMVAGGGPTPPRVVRLCLSDDNNDGSFEQLWRMLIPAGAHRGDNGWIALPYPSINGGLISSAGMLSAPASYSTLAEHGIAPITMEALYYSSFDGTASFLVTTPRDGRHLWMSSRAFDATGSGFPRTADILGAQVEVISQTDRAITYRVLRGFPEDAPLRTASVPPPAAPSPPRRN